MTFFLLAGGYGRRAEPLSREKPKPLFPLDGTPLLHLQLRWLRAAGLARGFINVHHLAEMIVAGVGDDPRISILHEEMLSGSLVLKRALPGLAGPLLIVNGDTYMEVPVAQMALAMAESRADGVLAVRPAQPGFPTLAVRDGRFAGVGPEPAIAGEGWMYCGAALFSRRLVAALADRNFFSTLQRGNWRVACCPYDGVWLEIGTPASYFAAVWAYKAHVGSAGVNALSAGAVIDPGADVKRSILWEGARIAADAELRDCIVTSGVHVGRGRFAQALITASAIQPLAAAPAGS